MADPKITAGDLIEENEALKKRVSELEALDRRSRHAGERLYYLVEGTAAALSGSFLDRLTQCLASALKVRYAFVSEICDYPVTRVRLLSIWNGTGYGEKFEYDVKGTPCEEVVARKLASYPSGVRDLFPEDAWLEKEGIESYLAIPLFNSTGTPLGHLGVMDTAPMNGIGENESILRIFAARAASELERTLAEEKLRESQRVLSTLMSNLPGMAYRCRNDRDWTLEFASDGSTELTGYTPEELVSRRAVSYGRDIIRAEDQERVWAQVQAALKERRPFQLTYRIKTARGEEKWVWEQGSGVFSPEGELKAVEGFITDITERKLAEEKIERLAHFDTLTELPNRALFFDRLGKAISYANRNRQLLALFFLDLDNFKPINDRYGHEAGDRFLKKVAQRLMRCIRDSDTVARIGGDEFTVILLGVNGIEGATIVAEKVLKELQRPFTIDGHEMRISSSIGISIYPVDAGDEDELVNHADKAMYVSKSRGKNGYSFYEKEGGRQGAVKGRKA